MTAPFCAVIVAGGAGTRLWPRSRRASPKHVLDLEGTGTPLIRAAHDRVAGLADEVLVLTEARQESMVLAALPGLTRESLILEPAARGTTSALALAAMELAERDPQTVMMSLPADHIIGAGAAFRTVVKRAVAAARAADSIVLVGLRPTGPSTALGYVEASRPVTAGRVRALEVARFVEKPDLERARAYVAGGHHYWNLAMFCFRVGVFLEELAEHAPEHHAGVSRVLQARRRGDEAEAARIYATLPTDAIDYTVMERSRRLILVPASFRWADVGSWPEVAGILSGDAHGNSVAGDAELIDTHRSLLLAPGKLVAAIGVEDLILIDTEDAILLCHRSRAQDVKRVVEALGRTGRIKYL